jgi:hypothetical protein
MSTRQTWSVAVIAGIVGAVLVLVLQLGIETSTGPDTEVDVTTNAVNEQEPTLDDAIHAAAEEAVEIEGGEFKGESFKIARIEVTANNPHITAYRVVLER